MTSANKSICSKCKIENFTDSAFCFKCGNMLQNTSTKNPASTTISNPSPLNKFLCSKCGKGNLVGSAFCSSCGNELKEPLQKHPALDNMTTNTPTVLNTSHQSLQSKPELESNSNYYNVQKTPNSEKIYRKTVYGIFRCKKTSKDFRVKIEETSPGTWSLSNPSPIEGGIKTYHEKLDIEGNFEFGEYPGCPYCKAPGALHCFCGRMFCWQVTRKSVKCPWCNENVIANGSFNNMKAGADV